MSVHHAAVVRGSGGAIVSVELAGDGHRTVTGIERFPFAAEPVVERVRGLRADEPRSTVVVDAEGLGDAVWELLDESRHRRGWRLYAKHGVERAELTRDLVVAVARRTFSFAPNLAEAEAMRKALTSLTRDVREDGPGSELAIALALVLTERPWTPARIW